MLGVGGSSNNPNATSYSDYLPDKTGKYKYWEVCFNLASCHEGTNIFISGRDLKQFELSEGNKFHILLIKTDGITFFNAKKPPIAKCYCV